MKRYEPIAHSTLAFPIKKIGIYIFSVISLIFGFYLFSLSFRRAVGGSPEALWTLILFFTVVCLLFWLVSRYWRVILDTNDLIDLFRSTAKEKKAKIEPVLKRTDRTNVFFKEQGYRVTLMDYSAQTEISLVQIEIETQEHFIAESRSYYLTFRIPCTTPQPIVFIQPKITDWHQPDLWCYCPQITMMTLQILHPAYHVFLMKPDNSMRSILENPFIVNDLNVLFSIYRLNFICISENALLAVKDSALESFAYDVEAYHILQRLIQLLRDHEKINSI